MYLDKGQDCMILLWCNFLHIPFLHLEHRTLPFYLMYEFHPRMTLNNPTRRHIRTIDSQLKNNQNRDN